jgi:uncharacterized repeat protein (TIGR01451 family)
MTAIVSQPVLPAWQRISTILAASMLGMIAAGLLLFEVQARPAFAPPPPSEAPLSQLQVDVYLPDTLRAASVLTHQLRYTNTLGVTLNNVVLTDSLSYKQYYSGTYTSNPVIPRSAFTYTGDFNSGYRLRWTIGTLGANAAGIIVLTSTVPANQAPNLYYGPTTLGNAAVITTTNPGVSGGSDSASVMIVGPVLRFTKIGTPQYPRPGETLVYSLTVDNLPTSQRPDVIAANHLVITDPVPAYTTFLVAGQGGVYSPTLNAVIWRWAGPLNPGAHYSVSMSVRLSETVPFNYPIANVGYCANADEIVGAIPCGQSVINPVGALLDKTAVTGPPPGPQQVWPKELVTYTIKLWNPHAVAVTVRLTDTLPGNPQPFQFRYMVRGPTPVITTPVVVWNAVPVPARTEVQLEFAVRVPGPTIITSDGGTPYYNALSARDSTGYVYPPRSGLAEIVVVPRVRLDKLVRPTHTLAGNPVTYTLYLINSSPDPVLVTRVTDTLPVQFTYLTTITGPAPIYQNNNVVAWPNINVPANGTAIIGFRARTGGNPTVEYCNAMAGLSPDTGIAPKLPGDRIACVMIDPPLLMDKTATPNAVYVGEYTNYQIRVSSVATTTYTIDQLVDNLPGGFLDTNNNTIHTITINPPYPIPPGGNWTSASFGVRPTKAVGCNNLPRTIPQPLGSVQLHVISPIQVTFVNAGDLAPLLVRPNAVTQLSASHTSVLPNEIFSYTIRITNTSSINLTGVSITNTLPNGFTFLNMVQGPPPAINTPPILVWTNQTIGPGGALTLIFNVRATAVTGQYYADTVTASTTADGCISGAYLYINVFDPIVWLQKNSDAPTAPPAGTVVYNLHLVNTDSVIVNTTRMTDTLPSGFIYLGMVGGDPAPNVVNGRTLIWNNLTLQPGENRLLRVRVQASILFGAYGNRVAAVTTRGSSGTTWYTLTVVPGIALFKMVYPQDAFPAQALVYTITLSDLSSQPVLDGRITDTLPSGFAYQGMISGPTPVITTGGHIAWANLNVQVGQAIYMVFRVRAGRVPGLFWNNVTGSSSNVAMPEPGDTAPVSINTGFTVFLPVALRR